MKNFTFLYLNFLLKILIPISLFANFLDLEEDMSQNFVLETKKVQIPEFPYAFNPSIVEWRNSILMCFRIGSQYVHSKSSSQKIWTYSPNRFGLIRLDKKLNPIGKVHILDIPYQFTSYRQQDPRLVTVGDRLFIVYSDMFPAISAPFTRRMCVGEIQFQNNDFILNSIEYLTHFKGENENRWEKNWVPFDFNGNLLLAYQINPHTILCPQLGEDYCETVSSSSETISWDWGELRGGTPALLLKKEEYLAFFHSSTNLATAQSNGIKMAHYFIGAYTFSSLPPFALTKISPKPIIGKNFYNGCPHQTWKPLRVVFPCGFIMSEKYIWISYGRQDHEIWIAKLDKKELLKSLKSIN